MVLDQQPYGCKVKIMRGFFNLDGPLFTGLSRIADMIILNLLFIVCCIPIVTIGASITALSYVMLKIKDGTEGYIVRSFFRSFKQNFKQSTLIWLIMAAAAVILYVDYRMTSIMAGFGWMRVIVLLGVILWLMVALYVFPLIARFENSLMNMLRNSVLLAMANAPKTVLMIALLAAAVVITLFNATTISYGILFWLLFGFSVIARINIRLLYGIFQKISPAEVTEAAPDDQFTIKDYETEELTEGKAPDVKDEKIV